MYLRDGSAQTILTCCHTEIRAADQTFYLTQSQYTDTGPTSPSADPITPGAWQGRHWSANFLVPGMTRPRKKIPSQVGFEPGIFRSRGGRLTTRPTRRFICTLPSCTGRCDVCTRWERATTRLLAAYTKKNLRCKRPACSKCSPVHISFSPTASLA